MAKNAIFNTVEEAIEDFREGRIVIVVDDEDRENEGDFIVAAEKITPEIVNFTGCLPKYFSPFWGRMRHSGV